MVELQTQYRMYHGEYFTSWKQLKDVKADSLLRWYVSDTRLLDRDSGYQYDLSATKSGFIIVGTPMESGPNSYHYYADDDRIVRREKGGPATKDSPVFDDMRYRTYSP
jgi:hypothetical protein